MTKSGLISASAALNAGNVSGGITAGAIPQSQPPVNGAAQQPAIEQQQNSGSLFPSGDTKRGDEISTTEIGRRAIKKSGGDLSVFGAKIPRIAPAIKTPLKAENALAGLLGGLFANRGPLADNNIRDYRDAASVQAAVSAPLTSPEGSLGPLTIYRPGLGNTAPGPAQIARLAMYTDKLIIAYANPGTGAEAKLRPLTHVDGVALPPEVSGKIFAIGSPENIMISWTQSSDLFLEQLEVMNRSGLELKNANATLIAHSQGGADSVATRSRLEHAGFPNVFGVLATENTPFRGSPVSDETMLGLVTELGHRTLGLQSMGAINALDPDFMKSRIRDEHQSLVDVSLVGSTDAGKNGRSDLRRFFKVSEGAIEASKWVSSLFRGSDVRENDGLVTVASQKFGRNQVVLDKAYDHAGIAEDPSIADVLAKHIQAARVRAQQQL